VATTAANSIAGAPRSPASSGTKGPSPEHLREHAETGEQPSPRRPDCPLGSHPTDLTSNALRC